MAAPETGMYLIQRSRHCTFGVLQPEVAIVAVAGCQDERWIGQVGEGHDLAGGWLTLMQGGEYVSGVSPLVLFKVTLPYGLFVYEAPEGRGRKVGRLMAGEHFVAIEALQQRDSHKYGRLEQGHPLSGGWVMLKTAGGSVFAESLGIMQPADPLLLTIHVGEPDASGFADVVATSMGGDEVAHVRANLGQSVRVCKSAIAEAVGGEQPLALMLVDGCMLSDDKAALSSVLPNSMFRYFARGMLARADQTRTPAHCKHTGSQA